MHMRVAVVSVGGLLEYMEVVSTCNEYLALDAVTISLCLVLPCLPLTKSDCFLILVRSGCVILLVRKKHGRKFVVFNMAWNLPQEF